ncbi:MAG TPA: ABC transporter permease subunit [Opitutaceae bacterium]|jgi:microcin C transport system permease protein
MPLSPQTRRQIARFHSLKRGYYSFVLLVVISLAAIVSEWIAGNRPLAIHYGGHWYLPVYGSIHPGTDFGLNYAYETDYRDLARKFKSDRSGNWLLMPPVPYGPNENCYLGQDFQPRAPTLATRHLLGTDQLNRDIFARLLYGLRNSLLFAGGFVILVYLVGVSVGCAMGYFGGLFDLVFQRFLEIWSLLPFLLVVIIVRAALPEGTQFGLGLILAIVVAFSWTSISYYVRTTTYREKARDYVAAAQVLGAGDLRIIFRHILPNVLSLLVTFLPFTAALAISSLTALDYLGFGLPPPMPSWGELLRQGTANLDAPWIVASAFCALSLVLILITFVGEAIRDAFDPKKFTYYR